MDSIVINSIVRELKFCQYEISLLLVKSNIFDHYSVMREVIETFSYITSFTQFGTPIYNYVLHKIGRSLSEVQKIKNSHKH